MRRLQQLLQTRIIAENDVLYFTFKKNKFTGHVAQGGLIWHCTWQRPGEEARPIFDKAAQLGGQPFVRTFESLTDWTETCIQECLDEYHTRYSSWKRVRHQRTEQTMETLFKHLQRQNLTHPQQRGAAKDNSTTLLLFEQIASQKQHIDALEKGVERWTAWFRQHHPNKMLPVQPIAHHVPQTQSSDAIAQPFVLNSARGQFMVLQRVNEVAPAECVSWLKSMGQSRFKQYMTDCEKQIEFTPMETTIPTSTTSAAAARQFVHEFFSA